MVKKERIRDTRIYGWLVGKPTNDKQKNNSI